MNATTTPSVTLGKTISLNYFPPYNLNSKKEKPEQFYTQLEIVTKQVVDAGMKYFGTDIDNYRNSTLFAKEKLKISKNEQLLEILMIGTFWNTYQGKWRWNIEFIAPFFGLMNKLRFSSLKKAINPVKGVLGSLMLNKKARKDLNFDIDSYDNLIRWIAATGDYPMEVKIMKKWQRFFDTAITRKIYDFLYEASAYAEWFEKYTQMKLGNYTENVQAYLQQNKKALHGREDQFFCSRPQVEYHLNMVGAQIMNNSLREEFLQTDRKILLLPACMAKSRNCKAILFENSLQCQHCSPDCNVSKTSREMSKAGVDTLLIKHTSDFSKWLKPWANQTNTGIIGTACVLNLMGGGYEMRNLGIPSQCIYLNFSGCKNHWDKTGVPTEIDIEKAKLLIEKQKQKDRIQELQAV